MDIKFKLKGELSVMSGISIIKKNAMDVGNCNFCKPKYDESVYKEKVWELVSQGIKIRICDECAVEVVKALGIGTTVPE